MNGCLHDEMECEPGCCPNREHTPLRHYANGVPLVVRHPLVTEESREQKVADLIAKWQPRLGLQSWDIRFNPKRKIGKGRDAEGSLRRYTMLAEIGIRKECPDSELESHVLHELLHIALEPLAHKAFAMAGALSEGHTILMDETYDLTEATIERLVHAMLDRRQMPYGKVAKNFRAFTEAA